MKKFTIDRIEDEKAVLECENGDIVSIDLNSLPKKVKEGDILYFEEGSCFLNKAEREQRRKKIESLMDSLFEE